ncbi:hypothetical protein [Aquabacter sediminis]|uniref:hypothetical protein n=1 Tax=Aquabacter sediminis TaxID=3029197 RepID=UPI00237E9860|nr:hypothetical protein [Aquabacter sp. P-9]MDE1569995.1 hypothetical protein [Aquabacter sp. P-9]
MRQTAILPGRFQTRLAAAFATAALFAVPAGAQPLNLPPVLRDARYCEILPIQRDGLTFIASVYNTLGRDDCPADKWKALTEADVKRRFDAFTAVLNGPRYFLMDKIIASGATKAGESVDLGGIGFVKRAEVKLSLWDLRNPPYAEHEVHRDTTFVFEAGKPTFQLTAPGGAVYVMQSYSRMKEPGLTYAALPDLGKRLELPKGWTYATVVLTADLALGADGVAVVVQDDLGNTYQRVAQGK